MPEEQPEETPNDADVEAEMLRMMQADAGEEAEGAEAGGGDGNDADDMMAALQEVVGQAAEGDDAPSENIDDMLEQEMLRAMSEDPGDTAETTAVTSLTSQMPVMAESVEGIDRLADVEVTVTVELGGNHIPIRTILSWTKNSTVELLPEEHEPVEVFVNGKPFAEGEVVVVHDSFGVRITKLIDPPDEPTL